MADLFYFLKNIIFFYYYIDLTSLIIFLSFFGDLHLSFGISLSSLMFSVSFVTLSKLSCVKVLETLMILSAILLPIKSPVASAVFSIDFFK